MKVKSFDLLERVGMRADKYLCSTNYYLTYEIALQKLRIRMGV